MTEINNNEILFMWEGAGISCFYQRSVSPQKDPEKGRFFQIFLTTELTDTEEGSTKQMVCGGL